MASSEWSGRRLDAIGAALVAAVAAWTVVTSIGHPSARPLPLLALLAGGLAAGALGRLGARWGSLVPAAVALTITVALASHLPELARPLGGPLGYANANATLAGLGAVASAGAAARSPRPAPRLLWSGLAGVLTATVALIGSAAAFVALALAAALVAADRVRRAEAGLAIVGGAAVVAATTLVTIALAAGPGADLGVRPELWARSLDLLQEAPGRGVGPGRLAGDDVLGIDTDLRWSHSAVLHQGAEQGVVGAGLLVALAGWLYLRLWVGRSRRVLESLTGAAATTLVGLHAAVDHVLHDAAVPLTLAVLVGWATADPPGRGSPGSPRPRR